MEVTGYRPGLAGVVGGVTAISEIDAETGQLSYRGYPVRELAEMCAFDEVAFLLLFGTLPNADELAAFTRNVGEARAVPDVLYDLYRSFPPDTHPMDALRAAVAVLATTDPDRDGDAPDALRRKAVRLYAKMPTLVANGYRISQGQGPVVPDPALCHNADFFSMLTGQQDAGYFGKVFNVTQILYAEHGFNASTFTARVTVSTLSDLYSGVVSALGALKGPLHGGANEAALAMLREIGTPGNAAAWVRDALADKRKIMGFGHREYRNGDDRARIVKPYAVELARRTGDTAQQEIAELLENELREVKGLFPNVDLPVAVAYSLMGLPAPLYTPVFAMSRVTGWCAHIMEQLADNRIIHPTGLYDGPRGLAVLPIEERE